MGLCHNPGTEKQRASRTKKSMCVDRKWMRHDTGEPGAKDLKDGSVFASLPIWRWGGGGISFLLTWCGIAGKAQVILSYPREAPVPFRNACSSLTTKRFTCKKEKKNKSTNPCFNLETHAHRYKSMVASIYWRFLAEFTIAVGYIKCCSATRRALTAGDSRVSPAAVSYSPNTLKVKNV